MKNRFDVNYLQTITYWLSTGLVGMVFILAGVLHLFNSNERVSDMLNMWSFFSVIGLYVGSKMDLGVKLTRVFCATENTRNIEGWSLVVNLAWTVISLVISSYIADWLWLGRNPLLLTFNTGGLTLIAMGLTVIMFYHGYKKGTR